MKHFELPAWQKAIQLPVKAKKLSAMSKGQHSCLKQMWPYALFMEQVIWIM